MLDKESATQEEVDAAIHQLADAADKLVEKTSVTPKPENNNTSGGNNSGNKPVTGDSATPIVLLAAVLASVFAVIRQMKKKIR